MNPLLMTLGQPLTDDRIASIESSLGFQLPDRYRRFVRETNGLAPRSAFNTILELKGGNELECLLPLIDPIPSRFTVGIPNKQFCVMTQHRFLSEPDWGEGPTADRMLQKLLPIGQLGGGTSWILLSLCPPVLEHVYRASEERLTEACMFGKASEHDFVETMERRHKVADSLDELRRASARPLKKTLLPLPRRGRSSDHPSIPRAAQGPRRLGPCSARGYIPSPPSGRQEKSSITPAFMRFHNATVSYQTTWRCRPPEAMCHPDSESDVAPK